MQLRSFFHAWYVARSFRASSLQDLVPVLKWILRLEIVLIASARQERFTEDELFTLSIGPGYHPEVAKRSQELIMEATDEGPIEVQQGSQFPSGLINEHIVHGCQWSVPTLSERDLHGLLRSLCKIADKIEAVLVLNMVHLDVSR
jgi:hypothetical protein